MMVGVLASEECLRYVVVRHPARLHHPHLSDYKTVTLVLGHSSNHLRVHRQDRSNVALG
jgi:hypothetical protein